MRTFTAAATREDDLWVVDVAGVGVTQGRTTAEAERMASGLVQAMLELDPADFTAEVTFTPPGEIAALIGQARAEGRQAAELQEHAAKLSRLAVHKILEVGLSKQDAARILKVAPQRISQLVK
ncbi:MAG: hypothetical protein ACRDRL_34290 [Sciscionella sp.]